MNEKYCGQCGESLLPGSRFCPGCGRPVNQGSVSNGRPSTVNQNPSGYNPYSGGQNGYNPPVVQQPVYQAPVRQNMTKKEYRKVCTNEKYRKDLKSASIVLYVMTVLNALIAVAANPWGLVDTGLYLALTLGMHLGKRKGCAVAILIVAIFNTIVMTAETGKFSGYLWIIFGISAVKAFSAADKEYESIYG